MNGRIRTWHRRYRVCDTADYRRADALADGPVLAAYGDALERSIADDASVILVREVATKLALNLAARAPAEAWGRAMAAAVVRTIAEDPGSGNVVHYADRSAHLAAFLAEAADGRPADAWYFERFGAYRRHDPAETVRAALLDHGDLAAGALRHLASVGRLAAVIRLLGTEAADALWTRAIVRDSAPAPEADRPLFAAALRLVEAILAYPIDRARADAAWTAYRAKAAADWRDPGALADAVADAVDFLVARFGLAWNPDPQSVETAVASLDWLDAPRLASRLRDDRSGPAARPRNGFTTRQRAWFDALAALAPRLVPHRAPAERPSTADALHAYLALTAAHPEWSDDPALPGFVRAVLPTALGRARSPMRAPAKPSSGAPTAAAGTFLLLRTVHDLRLPALARRCGFPTDGPGGVRRLLTALAARWSGLAPGSDPGIEAFAAVEADRESEPLDGGRSIAPAATSRFQTALTKLLLGRRLMDGRSMHFALERRPTGDWIAVAGDESFAYWPYAAALDSPGDADPLLARWANEWRELAGTTSIVVPPTGAPTAFADTIAAFRMAATGDRGADIAFDAIAATTVRAWATWLKHVGHSTTPYLLDALIRRPGRLIPSESELLIELDPKPFDVALQRSGYLDDYELPPGGPIRRLRFRIDGAI